MVFAEVLVVIAGCWAAVHAARQRQDQTVQRRLTMAEADRRLAERDEHQQYLVSYWGPATQKIIRRRANYRLHAARRSRAATR